MRGTVVTALLVLAAPTNGAAQDGPPPLQLRLAVTPAGPVWIGQRVTVTLTALTPVRFAAPPGFTDLAPRGRAVVLPETSTVPGTLRIGPDSLVALQHGWELFPAEAGDLPLPEFRLAASVGGPDGRPIDAVATVPGLRIPVRAPPGVADLTRLAVAPVLRLSSTTDRAPDGLRVGQAITRTVRLEATDATSMLLPPAVWGAPDGVAVYPDPPVLQDRADRGVLRAVRVERAAYVPQRTGPMEVPGFTIAWLDPQTGRVRDLRVEPIRLDVLPAADAGADRARSMMGIAALALLTTVGAGLALWRRRVRGSSADPECAAFAALAAACRSGDAPATAAALFRWSDAAVPRRIACGPRELAVAARQPRLAAGVQALEDRLYDAQIPGPWDRGRALLAAVRHARRDLRRAGQTPHASALPDLNPSEGTSPIPV